MKKLLLASLLISSSVFAYNPVSCPDVSQIKSVGLSSNLVKDANGRWYAGRTAQNYGTPQKWTFLMGGIHARTSAEALAFANIALLSLRYFSGPNTNPANKNLCIYKNDFNLPSGAVTVN